MTTCQMSEVGSFRILDISSHYDHKSNAFDIINIERGLGEDGGITARCYSPVTVVQHSNAINICYLDCGYEEANQSS